MHKSAYLNYPPAIIELGFCYAHGLGGIWDFEKSIELFLKAAELGSAEAEENLGMSYYLGRGVRQDLKKALYWFRRAKAHGVKRAEGFVVIIEKRLSERRKTRGRKL